MKNPFAIFFRSRDKPQDAVSAAPTFYFGTSASGKSVNPRNAVQVSTVYACVRVIAETIASLPIGVYEEEAGGSRKATEHQLYRLLHDEPNPEMTSFVMRETMMTHLLLWGNSYSQIIRSGRNKIIALYPLLPDRMEVDRDSKGKLTYTYTTAEGLQVKLDPLDVLHIPGLGFDGIMGYSPIALEKNAIGLGIAAEEYGSRFFQNGARPSGVLTHPNTVKDPKRLRESWNAAYGGSTNGSKVAILEESMTFTPISLPNNEAQFLETRKFQVEEICRIFRVPPHLVGNLDRATFSNIENQSIDFAVHTIRPWLVRIEQAMNRALFAENEKGGSPSGSHFFVQFNIDGLMRGDYKSRMEGYSHAEGNLTMAVGTCAHAEGSSQFTASFKITGGENSTTYSYSPTSRLINVGDRIWLSAAKEASVIAVDSEDATITLSETLGDALNNASALLLIGGATGNYSHTEGQMNTASGLSSHAEGSRVVASGSGSHAEGRSTKSASQYQHVQGMFNIPDANNAYADIVGNGTAEATRSNAYGLDWSGNGHYAGDVYVGCNPDSSGGTKLAKVTDIPAVPVTDVQVNGTSVLNDGVANVPVADASTLGVIKVSASWGLRKANNEIVVFPATSGDIKAGTNGYKPIVSNTQHASIFYGLAKAAGDTTQSQSANAVGSYTNDAKTAIRAMFGLDDQSIVDIVQAGLPAAEGVSW